MKLRILKHMAGPEWNLAPGAVVDMSEACAMGLIGVGAAEPCNAPETTTLEGPPDRAIKSRPRTRRGGKGLSDVR